MITENYERLCGQFLAVGGTGTISDFHDRRKRIGLRHDVDNSLTDALEMAEFEMKLRIRSTYFILHTADYYREEGMIKTLLEIQDMGHEIGFHNNLISDWIKTGIKPGDILARELDRLRAAGLQIRGIVAHGDDSCHKLGYLNDYLFREALFSNQFPHYNKIGEKEIPKESLRKFGLDWDGRQIKCDRIYSDIQHMRRDRDWFKSFTDWSGLHPSARLYYSVHPDYWMKKNDPGKI